MAKEKSKLETIVFPLLIVVLFIPLTFFAANTIIPDYKGYYDGYDTCYNKYNMIDLNATQQAEQDACLNEQEEERKEWQTQHEKYDMYRFFVVLALAIIALVVTLFIRLEREIHTGLFIGAVLSTVIGLLSYFESTSWTALGLLFILFIAVIWFIHKRMKE